MLLVILVCGLPYGDNHHLYSTVGDVISACRVVILTGAQREPFKRLGIEMTGSHQFDLRCISYMKI